MTTRKRKPLTEEQKGRKAAYERSRRGAWNLKYIHGITLEDYDMMLLTQNMRCAICGTDTPKGRGRFHVDHNHDTGTIRGLLCHECNTALGLLKDSPATLARAIEYLTDNGHYGPKETEGVAETFIN